MRQRKPVRSADARPGSYNVSAPGCSEFTVFIVDDDAGVLRALARLVRAAGYTVRTFSSAPQYLAKQETNVSGCLVLDVLMPDLDGRQLQDPLLRECATRPIIFISGRDDVPTAVAALKAGAINFLIKPIKGCALLDAIKIAVEQETKIGQQRAQLAPISRKLARLSRREAEVLRYVIAGHRNKITAWHLGTVEKTIKVHRGRMMQKLEVRHVPDLVRLTELAGIEPYNSDT